MSHHLGAQPQSSQAYQLLSLPQDYAQSAQSLSHLQNAQREPQNLRSPPVQVHTKPPSNSKSSRLEFLRKKWESGKFVWIGLPLILFFNIGLLVAIIYLQHRSSTKNGIVAVPQSTAPIVSLPNTFPKFFSKISHYSLLWTTLPTFVLSIYSGIWATIVSETARRQPYVELNRPADRARSAKTTIMLDYRTYTAVNNWYKAWNNGHVGLGFAMVLSSILTYAIGPLIASLLVSAASQSQSNVTIAYTNSFNDSIFDPNSSLQPFIDFSSSIRAYHAQPPSWMTNTYAFAAFQHSTSSAPGSGNITANTTAYSAILDCQAYSPEESNAQYKVDTAGDTSVAYSMNDRGCAINSYQVILNTTLTYSNSWNQPSCPGTPYGRIGIFAGIYSATSPIRIANYTLISCIPRYFLTTGLLTVSLASSPPNFISFNETRDTEIQPFWRGTIEHYLHNYLIFDPSNSISADAFGFAVLQYAQSQNRSSPMTLELFNSSIAEMYATLFVGLAGATLLQSADFSQEGVGQLTLPVQKLYVVDAVAWAIVAVLVCALVCNVYLWIHALRKISTLSHPLLVKEPKGLLGYAALIVGDGIGGLQNFVGDFKRENPEEWDVRKVVKERYSLEESKCWFNSDDKKIMVEGLKEKSPARN